MNTSKPVLEDKKETYSFIIGDVQGRDDLLHAMLRKIQDDPKTFPLASNDKIVVMGNFLHRRGNTQEIMDTLKSTFLQLPNQLVVLLGKPEIQWLKNRQALYTQVLGKSIVNSYRTRHYGNKPKTLDVKTFIGDMTWLSKNSQFFYETQGFFATTGGVDLKKSLKEQIPSALPYFSSHITKLKKPMEKIIVHGTIVEKGAPKVKVLKSRIGLNANPIETNTLNCAVIHNTTGKLEEIITVKKELDKKP